MAFLSQNICRNEMTIEESILPQIMKLESDIYLQNNGTKKTSVYAIPGKL
jgi:hypothetical protein